MKGNGGMDQKALREELKGLFTEFEKEHAAIRETLKEHESWKKGMDGLSLEKIETLNQKMGEIEMKLQRPQNAAARAENADLSIKQEEQWAKYLKKSDFTQEDIRNVKTAFRKYLRKGENALEPHEVKLLSTENATNGGYLVYPDFANTIIKDLAEISDVRSIARVQQTSTGVFKAPKRLSRPGAAWVGEGDTDSEGNSTYGLEEVPNNTMRATSKITREQLEDSAFDMESEIRTDFVEDFRITEGRAYVSGNAVGKPEGFMNNSDVQSDVTGTDGAITFSGMVDVSHNLNSNYVSNGRFVMSLPTLGEVRKLEDSGGNLIFMPATAGAPATILGFPYTILQDMPEVASNTYPVAFGDFRRAYLIIESVNFDLLRDPFTAKRDGAVEFTAFMRVGGQVMLATAIRKLQAST